MQEIIPKSHFSKKFNVFSKKNSFSRYVFSTFQTISSRLVPIPGDFFFEKCPCKFFFKFCPSPVTIAHVHAFFSLKLNAIIIFEIHIYSVP